MTSVDLGGSSPGTLSERNLFTNVRAASLPHKADKEAWGNCSQVREVYEELKARIEGPQLQFDRYSNPILEKVRASLAAGVSITDEVQAIRDIVSYFEAHAGQPLIDSKVKYRLRTPELFSAIKLCQMLKYNRDASALTEVFVHADAVRIAGCDIAARDIFVQHWHPVGHPSGRTVVVTPGYQETGRCFSELAAELTNRGHHVFVLDNQAAGQTGKGNGSIDSGFGLARDIAAVARCVGRDQKLSLVGNSICGGATFALMALRADDQWPQSLNFADPDKVILLSPFFELAPGNGWINFLSKIPLVNRISMPSSGIPVLTRDPESARALSACIVKENVEVQLSAMSAAKDDFDYARRIAREKRFQFPEIRSIHGTGDTLASFEADREVCQSVGTKPPTERDTSNHVLEFEPDVCKFVRYHVEGAIS